MQQRDWGDDASSLAATQPHAESRRELHTRLKKCESEPLMASQAGLPLRYTPHPYEETYNRWPKAGWKYGNVDPTGLDQVDYRRKFYGFGARQLRFKPLSKVSKEVPEMTLDELRNYLTQKYGSLHKAFDRMDFFRDGKLSAIEWQEGMYNALHDTFGTENHNYRMAIVPRKQFNARMQQLFYIMDEDQDGLIKFDELAKPYLEPEESGFDHSRRRQIERDAHHEEKKVLLSASMLTGKLRTKGPPEHHREEEAGPNIREFAVYLVKSFKDIPKAFEAFDVAHNGQLNLTEFIEGSRRIGYKGDAEEIFTLLAMPTAGERNAGTVSMQDFVKLRQVPSRRQTARKSAPKGNATMSSLGMTDCSLGMSRKDATAARKLRANIRDPPPHAPGLTLANNHHVRPLGQGVASCSDFFSIPRNATGRLDADLHPNQLPGEDAEQFSAEHGPGFVDKGPEYFPYMGMTDHPRRGDKWKYGATINREKRFSAMVPSRQGQADRDLAGMSYLSHEGRRPMDGNKICNTGGISWSRSPVRPGITNHVLLHRTR